MSITGDSGVGCTVAAARGEAAVTGGDGAASLSHGTTRTCRPRSLAGSCANRCTSAAGILKPPDAQPTAAAVTIAITTSGRRPIGCVEVMHGPLFQGPRHCPCIADLHPASPFRRPRMTAVTRRVHVA